MTPSIDLKSCIARGTGFHTFIGWVLFLLATPLVVLLSVVFTQGAALVGWVVLMAFFWLRERRALARLRGSALQVGEDQFPEIHDSVCRMSATLGLEETSVFVIEANAQNAFAIKHGAKHCVVLVDDVVFGAQATGNGKVLDFIIAHELAHHALGHTGWARGQIAARYRPLARLDEFSCDAVAHALVQDAQAARGAMLLLLIGPQLFKQVNQPALDRQVEEVALDPYTKSAQHGLTHPLLLTRYHRLMQRSAQEPARLGAVVSSPVTVARSPSMQSGAARAAARELRASSAAASAPVPESLMNRVSQSDAEVTSSATAPAAELTESQRWAPPGLA